MSLLRVLIADDEPIARKVLRQELDCLTDLEVVGEADNGNAALVDIASLEPNLVQFKKTGPWVGFNWRYDSGLVAGPVPCAGGNCANGPNGSDSVVDFSGLTPDQQYEAGLSCAGVKASPTTPVSATGLCAASQYASSLVSIPAPGTENDDHNPPRIASRNLFDLAIGDDNLFKGDKYKWSARITVVNLMDKMALYNFLSTFSGTHYVTPRTITATIGFHF